MHVEKMDNLNLMIESLQSEVDYVVDKIAIRYQLNKNYGIDISDNLLRKTIVYFKRRRYTVLTMAIRIKKYKWKNGKGCPGSFSHHIC